MRGNDQTYNVHLKTAATVLPWQSYRAPFSATTSWRWAWLPFTEFTPHRLAAPLDRSDLRKLGIVAIGRAFLAEVWVAWIGLYR